MMRKRILYTTPWYPGRGKVLAPFIQNHARAESLVNDVAVLAVLSGERFRHPRIKLEKGVVSNHFVEIKVFVPGYWSGIQWWLAPFGLAFYLLGQFKGYRYIKKCFWEGSRPDVCHVNVLTRAAGLPWLLKKFCGVPYIVTEHWTRYVRGSGYPYNKFHARVTRTMCRDASYICPVSENLENGMKSFGLKNAKYELVGNVVDTDLFILKHNNSSADIVRFVHVSWLDDRHKNVSGILAAFSQLERTYNKWELTIVGEGDMKESLEQIAFKLGIGNKVSFVGMKRDIDLVDVLCDSDCMVMFSRFENQPVSILEALSCGIPVIASSVGAIPEMLSEGRGLVVKSEDEPSLVNALENFVSSGGGKDETASLSRRDYIVNNHSFPVVAMKFDHIYSSVLNDR